MKTTKQDAIDRIEAKYTKPKPRKSLADILLNANKRMNECGGVNYQAWFICELVKKVRERRNDEKRNG